MGTDERSTVWNFAYGSNLDEGVRARRSLNASAMLPGVLREWKLVFDVRGVPPVEPSMASIAPSPGNEIHGLLLELTPAQLAALERSEGGGRFYSTVEVDVQAYNGRRIRAIAFQTAAACVTRERPPSSRYLELIRAGARQNGLDLEYCRMLEALPTFCAGRVDRIVGTLVMDGLMWSHHTNLYGPCHDYLSLLHRAEAKGGALSSVLGQALMLSPLFALGLGVHIRSGFTKLLTKKPVATPRS